MNIIYSAKVALVAGHVAGQQYTLSTRVQQFTFNEDRNVQRRQTLDGTEHEQVNWEKQTFNVVTAICVGTNENNAMREAIEALKTQGVIDDIDSGDLYTVRLKSWSKQRQGKDLNAFTYTLELREL